MNIEFILNQILDKLKSIDIYRVILFGSYAKAEATPDSDIDLVIILNNDDLSKTFSQKAERDAGVRELLADIYFKYEMDILIYSKTEFNEVKNRGNFFISEVERTGKIIYEKGKRRMIEGLNNQKPNRINIEPILNQILERLKNIKLYKVIL
ncbi:MAG: nucleotidyltransferase domain-containing protein, partial [Elusimicrobiota bacterium]|nr:nucleotidyltransferase domain-containing protein [Elusimicrobiota bacterium]